MNSQGVSTQPSLLRAEEVARMLNISRSKVFALMASGEIPGVVRIGRSVRVSRLALERWIEQQAGDPDATPPHQAA